MQNALVATTAAAAAAMVKASEASLYSENITEYCEIVAVSAAACCDVNDAHGTIAVVAVDVYFVGFDVVEWSR